MLEALKWVGTLSGGLELAMKLAMGNASVYTVLVSVHEGVKWTLLL